MKLRPLAVGVLGLALLSLLTPPSSAQVSEYFDPDTMLRVDEMQPGMKGVCRTVFMGSDIVEFNVEIVRVIRNFDGPNEMVLFRVLDGPLVERNSCVPRGMSGSPLYFNGKLAGAASRAVGVTKDPLAAFTPIEYMLECFDEMDRRETMEQETASPFYHLDEPLVVDGKVRHLAVECDSMGDTPAVYSDAVLPLVPVSMPLVLSGVPAKTAQQVADFLAPEGFHVMQGVAGTSSGEPYEVEAGSAIGIGIMSGDFSATGGGTVTYVDGDRFLAFGHPMFGDGKVALPATYMEVADFIVQETDLAEKILIPLDLPPFGTVSQDRNQAIGGTLGTDPPGFPISIDVDFPARNVDRTYNVTVAEDEFFAPSMAAMAVISALSEYLMASEDYVVKSTIQATSETGKTIDLSTYEYSGAGSVANAPMLAMNSVAIFMTNIFSPEDVAEVEMSFEIEERKAQAQLLRLELDDWVVEAGDTVEVKVIYRLIEGQGEREQIIEIPIDPEHPTGMTLIQVAGGFYYDILEMQTGVVRPQPRSLEQLIDWYETQLRPNNTLVVMMPEMGQAFLGGGLAYPNVPPEIGGLLSSAGTTDYGISAEARTLTWDTDYDIAGLQMHPLVIIRPEDRYASAATLEDMEMPAQAEIGPSSMNGPMMLSHPVAANRATNELWANYLAPPRDLGSAVGALGYPLGTHRVPMDRIERVRQMIDDMRESWLQGPPPPGIHMPEDAEPGSVEPIQGATAAPDEGETAPGESDMPDQATADGEEGEPEDEEIEPLPIKTPSTWVQSANTDFLSGHLEGTTVLDKGAVTVAAEHRTVVSYLPDSLYAWALAPGDDGGVLVGTGPGGSVYHIGDDGTAEVFFRTGDAQVFAIERLDDGTILVGTGPKGHLYHLTAGGEQVSVDDIDASYVWDIQPLGSEVLLATGPDGRILRGTPGEAFLTFADVLQDHVLCLTQGPDGDLYSGTNTGLLYRSAPDGHTRPMGSSPLGSVYDITVGPEGKIYFASIGNAYRIDPDGQIAPAIETPDMGSFAITGVPSGVFMATSEPGKIWGVDAEGDVKAYGLLPHPEGRPTDMLMDASGEGLWVVSTDPIVLYKIPTSPSTSGAYMSRVLDAGVKSEWLDVECNASLPDGTSLTIETRSGNEPTPGKMWSEWYPVGTGRARMTVKSPAARFLQYRLRLDGASGAGAPTVDSVEIRYVAANQKPDVMYEDYSELRYIKDSGELSWDGSDPEGDSMRYHLLYSADQGQTWEEIAEHVDDTSYTWDVSELDPGSYMVKIIGDDEVSNPGRGLTDQVIIGPLQVDNVAPTVSLSTGSVAVGDDGMVRVTCSATDEESGLRIAQYRVDGDGPWMPIAPRSEAFGDDYELLEFAIPAIDGGDHTLQVAVFDMAGNSAVATAD
ncbi:MAG: hypothetical protein GF320_18445, partial [Armatimonadia bacterium]|nr:hypothetical protein [Armatimonadia bacterium]